MTQPLPPENGPDPTVERSPGITTPADLRCSDVDRERVAEALRDAAGDGRLTLTELEERLEATYAARTYGDLQPITADLPRGPYPIPSSPAAPTPAWNAMAPAAAPSAGAAAGAVPAGPVTPSERVTNVLSSTKRNGRWEVPARLDVVNVLGDATLDFTEAIVRTPEVVLQIGVVLGELKIIVPEGIDVRVEASNILSETKVKLTEPPTPGAPVYRIRGFTLLGQVTVRPPGESAIKKMLGH